jgi:hypothetical protein
MSFSRAIYTEGIAAEHPDIEGQEEFRKKADEIINARRKRRAKQGGPQLPSFVRTVRKQQNEEKDHEHSMARGEIHKIDKAIKTLRKKLKGEGNIEAWVQSKITRAADYLDAASNYLDSGEHNQVDEAFDDVPEMRSRRITDAPSSSGERRGRKSPGELMRMLNQDLPKPKKKKKKKEIAEETMTAADKKKEERLKNKYDDSGMKASMIKQYGPEKGKQIYFATIRKQAMKEAFIDPEDEIPTSTGRPGRKPIENVASHPKSKVRRKAIEAIRRQMEKEYGGKWKAKSKDPTVDEGFDLLDEAKLPRAEKRARAAEKQKGKSKGSVHAFDVDETLFSHGVKGKPNVKVHVKDASGQRVKSLSNQEFNTHKLDPGHSYDFGEFRSAKKFSQTASPNKKVISKLKKLQKRGKNVHLITARDKFDKPKEFRQHFERHGIKLKPGNIHYTGGMKGGDVGQKKVAVAKGLAKMGKSKGVHMYDDAAKVHKAFEAEKKKNPKLKIKTHLAKPNKKGEVMTRSYQAVKEDFELWMNTILEEGYDISGMSLEELCYIYADELLDEYGSLNEAITAIGAPAPGDKPKKKFVSPYDKKMKPYPKKTVKEEEELTPYEFWKTFIEEDVEEEIEDEVQEEIEEDYEPSAYEIWKQFLGEKYIKEQEEDQVNPTISAQEKHRMYQRQQKKTKLAQTVRQAADELERE